MHSPPKPPLGSPASSGSAGGRAPASRMPRGSPAAPSGREDGHSRRTPGPTFTLTVWSDTLLIMSLMDLNSCSRDSMKSASPLSSYSLQRSTGRSMGPGGQGLMPVCRRITAVQAAAGAATENTRENPPHPWNTGGSSETGFIWATRLGGWGLRRKKLIFNRTVYVLFSL